MARRALILDPNVDVARRVAEMVSEVSTIEGTDATHDQDEALRLLERHGHEIVVVDVTSPALAGIDLLERAGRSPRTRLAIVLTNHDEPALRQRCLAAGAHHYLSKVHDLDRLAQLLEAIE